jgi:hypothetical protein
MLILRSTVRKQEVFPGFSWCFLSFTHAVLNSLIGLFYSVMQTRNLTFVCQVPSSLFGGCNSKISLNYRTLFLIKIFSFLMHFQFSWPALWVTKSSIFQLKNATYWRKSSQIWCTMTFAHRCAKQLLIVWPIPSSLLTCMSPWKKENVDQKKLKTKDVIQLDWH